MVTRHVVLDVISKTRRVEYEDVCKEEIVRPETHAKLRSHELIIGCIQGSQPVPDVQNTNPRHRGLRDDDILHTIWRLDHGK